MCVSGVGGGYCFAESESKILGPKEKELLWCGAALDGESDLSHTLQKAWLGIEDEGGNDAKVWRAKLTAARAISSALALVAAVSPAVLLAHVSKSWESGSQSTERWLRNCSLWTEFWTKSLQSPFWFSFWNCERPSECTGAGLRVSLEIHSGLALQQQVPKKF